MSSTSSGSRTVALTSAGVRASIDPVGAALQSLEVDGRRVVVGHQPGPSREGFFGALLVPWPNRLRDGAYTFDGVDHQAAVNEVERRTALHGLAAWTEFDVLHHESAEATLRAVVPVQPAYPTRLVIDVHVALDGPGVTTTVTATNTGDRRAPYGVSTHPYLTPGGTAVDDWTLELAAPHVLEVDDRLLPTGTILGAAEAGLDLRSPRPLRGLELDHCFGADGQEPSAVLRGADGRGVSIAAAGDWARWWQVFTSDALEGAQHRAAVAIEPMSCPPDAFRTATDLVVLEPGAQHVAAWTISAL